MVVQFGRSIVRMSTGGAGSDGDHMAPAIESVMYVLTVWQGLYTSPSCEIYHRHRHPHLYQERRGHTKALLFEKL